jgi:peptidoglycan/LPS O-acetylase OafA/YrhL
MLMPKTNNFDLIRLAAALQVAITHSIVFLAPGSRNSPILYFIDLFPGVPIFFFVSGFLISKSFEKNANLKEFAFNRFLRIYPGLASCLFISLGGVWLVGCFDTVKVPISALLLWVIAQASVVQFYNPDFLRHCGTGVINGSMWTVAVELQFYVLLPILYAVVRTGCSSRRAADSILLGSALAFLAVNQAYVFGAAQYSHDFWYKLTGVSFLPWFYMFLVGVLFQRSFALLHGWVAGRFAGVFVLYCAVALIANRVLRWNLGNTVDPLLYLALCILTFSAAFSRTSLSDWLLGRNDLSYGVYIYHMPVVNLMLAMGVVGGVQGLLIAMAATLVCAYASWRMVERPALSFKKHPLYQHDLRASARERMSNS